MKKYALFLVLLGAFYSCSIKTIQYSYNYRTIQQGIDFNQQQGNWLLNTNNIQGRYKEKILAQFNKWTKDKTTLKSKMIDKYGTKVNNFFTVPLAKESFKFIKETTNYRYLINVYLVKNHKSTSRVNIIEIVFDIFDIKEDKLILSEIVTARMDNENTSSIGGTNSFRIDVEPNMINGLIKKGLKKIGKNSIY